MIRKLLTKQAPKPILDSTQLQVLVTDLTKAKEGGLVGGQTRVGFITFDTLMVDDRIRTSTQSTLVL